MKEHSVICKKWDRPNWLTETKTTKSIKSESCPLNNEPDRSEEKDVENLVCLVERKTTKYQINSTQSKD